MFDVERDEILWGIAAGIYLPERNLAQVVL